MQPNRRLALQALIAPAIAASLPVMAQTEAPFSAQYIAHAQLLRDSGLRDTTAWTLTQSLVREVGPRAAGSAGDAKAVQWALDRLKALGFANVRAEPVPLVAWQRGATTAHVIAPEAHSLVVEALGNTVGTTGDGIEADVAYYADFESLRRDASDQARGKIVFVDQKTERSRDGSGYSRAILSRVASAVEASRRGAVAVAIRSLGTDRDRIAHTGAMRYDPAVAQIPALAVSVPDADLVGRLHATGKPLRMRVRMERTSRIQATSHNVIGEVPGSDLASEIVMIGAHLDSWDITPGAQDDASGVGIVTAASRAILDAGRKPRRTIRVELFANEENGFDGANAYAEKYRDEPHQLVGESDFGAARIWRLRSRVRADALPVINAIAQQLAPLTIAQEGNNGSPGPDAAVLSRTRGWAGIELTQDGSNYFDIHHTVNDTLDRIDPATLPHNVAAWAVVAWLSAQSPVKFGPLER